MEPLQNSESQEVFHGLNNTISTFSTRVIIIFIFAILLGIGSGFSLAKFNSASSSNKSVNGSSISVGTVYGSGDSSTFKDMAEGVVQKGGIGNEGQFHLVRPGGPSQYVYMTSSLVDLNQFINHKVKVFGQTQKAQQAGWLMDVGRLEVE